MSAAPGTYPDLPSGLFVEEVAVYRAAEHLLLTRRNDLHARVACQYVMALLAAEGGDRRVAVPAILLHDVGWSEVPEDLQSRAYGTRSSDPELNRLHETAGACLARALLAELAYPEVQAYEIVRIVECHDSGRTATTVEEAVVKDADKVYRVSRIGFAANLDFQAIPAQELHDFIAVRASRWFLTPTGLQMALAEMAARRHEYGLVEAPDVPPPPGDGLGDMGT